MKQIAVCFWILAGKVIRHGKFTSQSDFPSRIMDVIYLLFNATMSKPFKCTYQGKPLTARCYGYLRADELA